MPNLLLHGDCLPLLKTLPAGSVDLVLCDLPYDTTQNDWECPIPLDELFVEYWRVLKSNGVVVLTGQGIFTARLILSQPQHFKYKLIWVKSKATNFLNAKKQPLRRHEDICVFYRQPPTYNPQMREGEAYDKGTRKSQLTGSYGDFSPVRVRSEGGRYPDDILYTKTAEAEGPVWHPTQKPVALGRELVRTYSNPGDIVLDNTFGSGSFLVAALTEGRNFIGMEKGQEHRLFKGDQRVDLFAVARARLWQVWQGLSLGKRGLIQHSDLIEELEAPEASARHAALLDLARQERNPPRAKDIGQQTTLFGKVVTDILQEEDPEIP